MEETEGLYSEEAEIKRLLDLVGLGLDVQQFINDTPVGKLLTQRAAATLMEARSGLEEASPDDVQGIRKLQMEALSARNVLTWLGDAIAEGNNSEAQLKQREEVDHG